MRIPNKFSGYRFDGTRNLHDPATLAAIAAGSTGTATMAGVAAPLVTAATVAPVATSAGLGILPQVTTGLAPEVVGGAQGIMSGTQAVVPEVAKAVVPEVAKTAGTEVAKTAGTELAAQMPVDQVAAAGQKLGNDAAFNQAVEAFSKQGLGQNLPEVAKLAGTAPGGIEGAKTSFELVNSGQQIPLQTTAPRPPVGDFVKQSLDITREAAARGTAEGVTSQLKMPTLVNPMENGFMTAMKYATKNPLDVAGGLYAAQKMGILGDDNVGGPPKDNYKSKFDPSKFRAGDDAPPINQYASAPNFFSKTYAEGGNVGAVEAMSNMNAVGNNSMYPMANIPRLDYANPMQQRPVSQNMMTMGGDVPTDPYTGMQKFSRGGTAEEQISEYRRQLAKQEADRKAQGEALMEHAGAKVKGPGIFDYTLEQRTGRPDETAMSMFRGAAKRAGVKVAEMPKANIPQDFTYAAANGGIMRGDLGGYSDGGRLLKGPGDGVSDSIPAVIGNKQPARLADGEFVVPARIVSELGNGSTEAGARQLYAMMERIQKGRRKSVGKNKVAVDSKSKKHLPA